MLHWQLLSGQFPVLLLVAAAVAGVFLLLAGRGTRRWWAIAVPASIVGSIAVTLLLDWFVEDVWRPFPDALPTTVLVWSAAIIAGIGLAIAIAIHPGWPRRVGAVVAVLLVAAASLNQINRDYGYYPTLSAVLGQHPSQQVPLPPMVQAAGGHHGGSSLRGGGSVSEPVVSDGNDTGGTNTDPPGGISPGQAAAMLPLIHTWHPHGAIPTAGVVSQVTIPGTVSHFSARPGWVYLPPAYLMTPRPDLPVLILIAGEPGSPENWIEGGNVITTMDRFAASHHGLAPIVVMPDATGSTTGNPLCINSALGNSSTYLSTDVPNWVRSHLQVNPNSRDWAVGGFSYGGTCSWQLVVTHPEEFRTFLDISGSVVPTLGTPQLSANAAFGGNLAKLNAAMPATILKADRANPRIAPLLRRAAGTFVVGSQDGLRARELKVVMRKCEEARIGVRHFTEPGTHSWYVASMALQDSVSWLAARMGLV